MGTAPPPKWSIFVWGGGVQLSLSTTQTCILHKNVIFLKMKFFGVLLKISPTFKKFYNIVQYKIKICDVPSEACGLSSLVECNLGIYGRCSLSIG